MLAIEEKMFNCFIAITETTLLTSNPIPTVADTAVGDYR
jgi:hypothetical protein